jgi:hypothetical protein
MDNKTIKDIAEKLETITEKSKPQEIGIDDLIKRLQEKKKEGYKTVKIDGWLYGEKGSTSAIIATNSFYG